MRPVQFGYRFPGEDFEPWADRAFRLIEDGSLEDAITIADAYTITAGFTPTRSINAATATVTQLANLIATFLDDLQKRSTNRVE